MKLSLFSSPYKNYSDEELMQLIIENNSAAFEEIYNRYSKILLHFFYKMLGGDEQQSQDFLHDIFLKIIEKPYLFDQSKVFKTWIFQIALNKCKNEYRRRANRNNSDCQYEIKKKREADIELNSAFDESIDNKKLHEMIFSEIKKFKEEHSATFILRFQHGLSVKEIARILECPPGTVKSRIFYTTQKLLKTLKRYDPHFNGV